MSKFCLSDYSFPLSKEGLKWIDTNDIKKFLKEDEVNITKLRMKEICWREYFEKRDKLLGSDFVHKASFEEEEIQLAHELDKEISNLHGGGE